jgi:hypothetical protein
MPVFWNCHDLAIRLAHIIVEPSMEVINSLKRLMILLRRACNEEVNWHSAAGKLCVGGWGALALGGLASIPPLAAVGTGVFMIGWSTGFFGGICERFKRESKISVHAQAGGTFPSTSVASPLDSPAQYYLFPFDALLYTTTMSTYFTRSFVSLLVIGRLGVIQES